MKHMRDEGAQPDQTLQSQTALAARQQLGLALPQLSTPSQKSAGLHAAPQTPGLGYTPTLTPTPAPTGAPTDSPQPGASPAATPAAPTLAAISTPPAALTPAPAPAPTPSTPSALPPTGASTSQQPISGLEPTQSQGIRRRLQPHYDHVQPHQQQQQQRRAADDQSNKSSLVQGDGSTKHWQGSLYVVNAKGEEFVCELATDAWPAYLSRYATVPVGCVKQEFLLPSAWLQQTTSHWLLHPTDCL